MTTMQLTRRLKDLPDTEKLRVVDDLLADLDRPDPELDRVWAAEARRRWQSYKAGRARSIGYADVMKKYRRP
jgi:putative addiction module component (TIGR02574 family)